MGKSLLLRERDVEQIDTLKDRMRARTRIEVVRVALDLLEHSTRVRRWARAVTLVAGESRAVQGEFQRHSRLKRLECFD